MASPGEDIVGNTQNRKHPPLSALVDLDRERDKLARLCGRELTLARDPAAAQFLTIIEREEQRATPPPKPVTSIGPVPGLPPIVAAYLAPHHPELRACPDCMWTGPAEDYRDHRRDDHG